MANYDYQSVTYRIYERVLSRITHGPIRNVLIIFGLFSIGFGVTEIVIHWHDYSSVSLDPKAVKASPVVPVFYILFGFGLWLFFYLQIVSSDRVRRPNNADDWDNLDSIKYITESITEAEQQLKGFAMPQAATGIGSKKEGQKDKASEVTRLQELRDMRICVIIINEDFERIVYRIQAEIARLGKSANVNLICGTLIAILGVVVLASQVLAGRLYDNIFQVIPQYLPKLSLVIFIEVFAFFFLRIYKENLMDIKYFHNERTNIEQKLLSLKVASLARDQKIMDFVLKELSKAERNFVLRKGQSTVELEKERLGSANNKSVLEALKSVLKMKLTG